MSLFVDQSFVSRISHRFTGLVRKSTYNYNMRCCLCGDSKKSKSKKRGYIYAEKNKLFYKCFNCGVCLSFASLLKKLDPDLYREYQMEIFKSKNQGTKKEPDTSFLTPKKSLSAIIAAKIDLPTVEALPEAHTAKKYCLGRKLPLVWLDRLYYADDFAEFAKQTFPNYTKKLPDEPRIIIPFYDEKGALAGTQGRSLSSSGIRYITLQHDDAKKIFGLNRLDFSKTIQVVEGPFDSMFLTNAVATMDSALYSARKIIDRENCDYVFIYDNENRNEQIIKTMSKTIELGEKVVIWPNSITAKDINEMVQSGLVVENVIAENTYQGLSAKLHFDRWRKI